MSLRPLIVNRKWLIAVLIGCLSLLLTAYHSSVTLAQTTSPYEKAKSDYSAQIKKYNDAKNTYITAKANYTAFKTATAKTDAFNKTKDYLTQTNFLIVDYLYVVKEYGNQIHWENSIYKKEDTLKLVDDEINYLQNNWNQIQSANILEQLPIIASDLSKHLENSTNPVANKDLAIFEIIKVDYSLNNFNQLSKKLIDFAQPKINEQNRSIINNWQSDIESIKKETDVSLSKAKSDLEKIPANKPNKSQTDNVLKSTKHAGDSLLKSQSLFGEILRIR